jgi:hypothetical protein
VFLSEFKYAANATTQLLETKNAALFARGMKNGKVALSP